LTASGVDPDTSRLKKPSNGLPQPMPDSKNNSSPRHDWTRDEVEALFDLPFSDLIYRAQQVHRRHFDANDVQVSTLLSIKTGRCPEDCKYCPQSVRWNTGLEEEALLEPEQVRQAARRAKAAGAQRFCMGAAWRRPKDRQLDQVIELLGVVRAEGLETCLTVGMLTASQAHKLGEAGLDYYNHNLDTSPEHYAEIITTRSYEDRLTTLAHVREAGMKVCCGGIVGMGESRRDRAALLVELARLPEHPQSVPINQLVQVPGTPLDGTDPIDPFEFIRTIAVARIMLPTSRVRLSAGRESMNDQTQALCFLAGANSIFYGDKLLTTGNPDTAADDRLFARLGINQNTNHHETLPESTTGRTGPTTQAGRTAATADPGPA
jgi:biotin synthase